MSTDLSTLERWMQAVIMHPGGADAGLEAKAARRLIARGAREPESVVLPSKQLSSVERLEIYAYMYYARLIEILQEEYPTTRQLLGPHEFAVLCRKFIARNPSRSRVLNRLSEKFPDFLARALPKGHKSGLAVDVARIERAMEDVFDAPKLEPMTAAQFAAIGADQWERVRLNVNPALRLLKLRYPANEYIQATRAGRKPRIPRPRPTFVIVFRRGFQVFRRDQEPEQFRLLEALASGRVLAAAVRAAIRGRSRSADRLAAKLGGWFREWAAAGIFVSQRGRSPSKGERHL